MTIFKWHVINFNIKKIEKEDLGYVWIGHLLWPFYVCVFDGCGTWLQWQQVNAQNVHAETQNETQYALFHWNVCACRCSTFLVSINTTSVACIILYCSQHSDPRSSSTKRCIPSNGYNIRILSFLPLNNCAEMFSIFINAPSSSSSMNQTYP